ncbi:MAG: hypothetical protein AB7F86_10000 [Bdellovibrionales bacterium]
MGKASMFYSVSQDSQTRTRLAAVLNCQPDDLVQDFYHNRNWMHDEICELLIHQFQSAFPTVSVIREKAFGKSELARNIMMVKHDDLDFRPDFLMIFSEGVESRPVSIAVELERTRKSDQRLVRKLRKYAMKTRVDGIVYICRTDRLADTIRLLFKDKQLENSGRIGHYGQNFILFTDAENSTDIFSEQLYNTLGEHISLKEWLNYLRLTTPDERRDRDLSKGVLLAPQKMKAKSTFQIEKQAVL